MKHTSAGQGMVELLIVVAVLFFIFAFYQTCSRTAGATPEKLTITGPPTLVNGQSGTYTLNVTLDGKPETPREFRIRIDENDFIDDTLAAFIVQVNTGEDAKSMTFDLTCEDLKAISGEYDLVGDDGTSADEKTHGIHAEYGRGPLAINLTSEEDYEIDCVFTEEELEPPTDESNQ
ncbi:MAG: hypothetical protein D6690_10920 [Nitrospirae bacterium]|nr:MAG: hypothetical protein D6690_10920 [Nitrospirota bacterium]